MTRGDEKRRAGSVRWWGVAAALPALAFILWTLSHHVRSPRPARFSVSDLPVLVDDSVNGVPLARRLGAAIDVPDEMRRLVSESDPAPSWEHATERLLALREVVGPHRATLDAIDARARFRDDCRHRIEDPCDVVSLLHAHELASLDALARVAELAPYDDEDVSFDANAWAAVDARAARLVERSRDFASAPRALLSAMVAGALLERSVLGARPLVHGASVVGASLPRLEAALAEPFVPAPFRAAVIAEHLRARDALTSVALGLFGDRARTSAEIDDYFEGVVAHLDDPAGTPLPRLVPHEDRVMWWLYDPAGKAFFDAMIVDMGSVIMRGQDIARRAEDARRELHEALSAER